MNISKTHAIGAGILVFLGVVARLLPHIPNATPITALALFSAGNLGILYALPVVLVSMLISDALIGFYSLPILLSVYGSFLLIACLGLMLKKHNSLFKTVSVTAASSILFYLITNLAVWRFGTMYPHTLSGLGDSYFMALPFFRNTLIGDFFYVGVFFGGFALLTHYSPLKKYYGQNNFVSGL